MGKRRIKRNFDEQLATVSSLANSTPQNWTNDETKPNKKRTWHSNKVWRKDDPCTQVGGDPKVKDLTERSTKVKVNNFDKKMTTISSLTTSTPQNWTNDETKTNKKRTWNRNRVWRKDDPQTQFGGDPKVKDLTERSTKVKVNDHSQNNEIVPKGPCRKPGPLRWRYNRIWRRDFVWKKEHSQKSCLSAASVPAPPSAELVALQSKGKTSTDSAQVVAPPSKTAPATASSLKSATSRSVALPFEAAVLKSEACSISGLYETVVYQTVTASNNKTHSTISNNGKITMLNDKLTSRDKMAPTIETKYVSSSTEKTGTSSVKTCQSTSTEQKMERKSLKRNRTETRNVPNKRVLLTSSADDTRLSSRWLWSIETLMEQLCLAFEGFFY